MIYKTATIDLDANGYQIQGLLPFRSVKRLTFDGATTNDPGDKDGTNATSKLFDVTGDVLVMIMAVCKETIVGAATLEVGVTGNTASLLAQIANASTMAVNMSYIDATPALAEGFSQSLHVIGGGLDINKKIASADVTDGIIDFYCFWRPLSDDGNVVAA